MALLSVLVLGRALEAAQCFPPDAATEKLRAYLVHENGLAGSGESHERFTATSIGDYVLLKRNGLPLVPANYDARLRQVYLYTANGAIDQTSCPNDGRWIACAIQYIQVNGGENILRAPDKSRSKTCEFTLDVPMWTPSPASPIKTRIASELLREIEDFTVPNPSSVFVGDFNLNDPDISVYVRTADGDEQLVGCFFDAKTVPHCHGWHLFGQVSTADLRRGIMERPYRLFPLTEE